MRTAIVYASVHHGNTEKLVKRIAEECQVDLIDAVKQPDADLSSYDIIGFAAGTIQAFVPNYLVSNYQKEMDKIFGNGSCEVLKIRKYGGIKVL